MSTRQRWGIALVIWAATAMLISAFYWDERQVTLTIAAGPASSESFKLATSIAEVLRNKQLEVTREVYETRGSTENVGLLETSQVDLATLSNNTVLRGGISTIAALYKDVFQLVVAAELLHGSPCARSTMRRWLGAAICWRFRERSPSLCLYP